MMCGVYDRGIVPDGRIQLTRDKFREGVFKRDHHKCVMCGERAKDAHHILERRLWGESAGYFLDNGASLCSKHHLEAEMTTLSVKDIRTACHIEKRIIPDQLYKEYDYDKWGNIILTNGNRLKGVLFHDESVQKIMKQGNVLNLFLPYIKYQRTYHLPTSPTVNKDDRQLVDTSNFDGEEVVVTIKMDGENCLSASSRIQMADGTIKTIKEIVDGGLIGEYVMGCNEDGEIAPTKILSLYNNGRTDDWVKVSVRTPNGGPSRKIYCTPNHKFKTIDSGWIAAKDLVVGQQTIHIKKQIGLTDLQYQVLLGKVFGDGSIHIKYGNSALIQFGHKQSHEEYVDWTNTLLGNISNKSKCLTVSGYGSTMVKSWTKSTDELFDKFSGFINDDNVKIVPHCVVDDVTPLTIAFWYMDDGTLVHSDKQRDRMQFSVCGFDTDSCEVLQKCLAKFGVDSTLKEYNGYRYINVNADNTIILAGIISEYFCDVMRYKLPEDFRDSLLSWNLYTSGIPCVNDAPFEFRKSFSYIDGIEYKSHRCDRVKYDLETDTHNYFANNTLVHNCTMYSNYIHARSLDSNNHPSRNWVKNFHSKIMYDIPEGWRICGENLYAKHSIEYAELDSYFQVFSIWDEKNECLSWEDTLQWCDLIGLEHVPVLYEGEFDADEIHKRFEQYQKDSTDEVEGYVVRLVDSFHYGEFKDSIAKWVRPDHVQCHGHWTRDKLVANKRIGD